MCYTVGASCTRDNNYTHRYRKEGIRAIGGGGGDLITEFPFTKEMVKSLMQHRSTSGMKKQSKCGHIDTPTEATKLGKK